jgi:hypothetical protein
VNKNHLIEENGIIALSNLQLSKFKLGMKYLSLELMQGNNFIGLEVTIKSN